MEDNSLELKKIKVQWLGLVDYDDALIKQAETADLVRGGGDAVILACEHPTVITLGKRGQPLSDILASMEALREEHIKIVGTDRGGQATLHNPGQLVIYPILPLRRWKLGARDYVACLERATAHFLAEFGMEVIRGYEPGLFVSEKKIASFGIRIDRGVCLHGVAINIFNKINAFSLIRQCGMTVGATNLQLEMEEFTDQIPTWDFEAMTEKWQGLFAAEIKEVGIAPKNTSLDSLKEAESENLISEPLPAEVIDFFKPDEETSYTLQAESPKEI